MTFHEPNVNGEDGGDISGVIKKRKISWLNSRKFEADLASDHIRVDVLKEVIEEVDAAEHKGSSIQEVLERILQYTPLQVFLLVLAIIDVVIVVSEILVTLHVYDIERSDAESSLESVTDFLSNLLQTNKTKDIEKLKAKLNESFQHFHQQNISHPSWNIPVTKSEHRSKKDSRSADDSSTSDFIQQHHNPTIDKLHLVENVLDIITITILGFFVLIALLHLIAKGKKFFNQVTEILDSVVSIISFTLYVTKHTGVLRKDATEAIIVLLLLWQIVHMFNGIVMSEMKRKDFRIKLLKKNNNKLETKLVKRKKKIEALQGEIDKMKILCKKNGVEWLPPIQKKKMKPSLTTGIARLASLTLGVTWTTSMNQEMEKQEKKRRFGCSHVMDDDVSSGLAIGQLASDVSENGRSHNWADNEFCMTPRKKCHVEGLFLGRINEAAEYDDDDDARKDHRDGDFINNKYKNNNNNTSNKASSMDMNIITIHPTPVLDNGDNNDYDCVDDDDETSQSLTDNDDDDDYGGSESSKNSFCKDISIPVRENVSKK